MGLDDAKKAKGSFDTAASGEAPKVDAGKPLSLTDMVGIYTHTAEKVKDLPGYAPPEPIQSINRDILKVRFSELRPMVVEASANGMLSNKDAREFFKADNILNPAAPKNEFKK